MGHPVYNEGGYIDFLTLPKSQLSDLSSLMITIFGQKRDFKPL
jgi:hypothetical protein